MNTPQTNRSNLRIRALVGDDDPMLRSLVASHLAVHVDDIIEAEDGIAAWRHLRSEPFALAVIDLAMPVLDGHALLQVARGHPATRHLPIIIITASEHRETIERTLQLGATAYLTKPINWALFSPYIEHLLSQHHFRLTLQAELDAARACKQEIVADLGIVAGCVEAIRTAAAACVAPDAALAHLLHDISSDAKVIEEAVARMRAAAA